MERAGRLSLLLLLAPLAALGSAGSARNSSDLTVYNHAGLSASISNSYDGSSYAVRLTHFLRNGTLLRDTAHSDGYQELARAVSMDEDGSLYVTGVRYWQGSKYLWAMKYNSSGYVEWEWSDDAPGCAASEIELGAAGGPWIAGACAAAGGAFLRLVRLSPRGYRSWAHSDVSASEQLAGLSVDAGDRASMTALADGRVRTIVVDGQGRTVTTY